MPFSPTVVPPILGGLRQAVHEMIADVDRVTLAFSGGLDSSVVASLASEGAEIEALTVGYPKSQDLTNAAEASRLLGLNWKPVYLDDAALIRGGASLLETFPDLDAIAVSFEIPLWMLLPHAPTGPVLAGQGADELFGGYARYAGLNERDLQEALEHDLELLLRETIPREKAMARHHERELRLPYCHPRVLNPARALPADQRARPRRKELLRRVATELGLPAAIVERPKKAAQYGSGVMPALRRLARAEERPILEFLRLERRSTPSP
ncbi:MAG: asparagine synthase C-terminal domain-containing protein [Thermoplasmata archaeon]